MKNREQHAHRETERESERKRESLKCKRPVVCNAV